jgi:hypothetical protein
MKIACYPERWYIRRALGSVDSFGPMAVGTHHEDIYCGRLGLSRDDLNTLHAHKRHLKERSDDTASLPRSRSRFATRPA